MLRMSEKELASIRPEDLREVARQCYEREPSRRQALSEPIYATEYSLALSYSGRMSNREILEILREQTEAWNRGDGVAWAKNSRTTAIL